MVDAIGSGGVGPETVEKVLPDLVGLRVPLGIDADAEDPPTVPHWEDLTAELPVDSGQGRLP